LLPQLVVVTATLIVAFGLFAQFNRHRLDVQYGVHALDIARVVASSPTVLNNIVRYDGASLTASRALADELASGPLQSGQHRSQRGPGRARGGHPSIRHPREIDGGQSASAGAGL
jgi:two-component system CitB family sensor kinase